MLLQALHEYAQSRKLLADLPLQRRTLHALIDLDADGKLRLPYVKELTQPDAKGKESPGFDYLLPRFPGENNGGKAYFLAEGSVALFGRDKTTGEPIPAPVKADSKEKDKNPTKAFLHFWDQIQAAFNVTNDARLKAMLAFKREYLLEHDGFIQCQLPFVRMRAKDKGKKVGELEFVANIGTGEARYIAVKKATFGFSVDGTPVTLGLEEDALREYWSSQFVRQAFVDESEDDESEDEAVPSNNPTVCLVSGRTGRATARSHKPKIMGVPGAGSGGYIVSFAKAAPAFSSYGFEMGENAPVSESAAAMYALALTELLRDEESQSKLGPVVVCSWAKNSLKAGGQMTRLLTKAFPSEVGKFLKAPFAGDEGREVRNADRLYTVALSGNKARIIIQHWIDQTLFEATKQFQRWWDDLQVAPMFSEAISATKVKEVKETKPADQRSSPFAIPSLARVMLRQSKDQEEKKLVAERIVQLYRAALEGIAPSLMLLKPILDEFHTALVKNDPKLNPFNPSRFALIKLILIRFFRNQPQRKEGDFMPTPQLADTPEPAYNLGRLLAVFESLQDRYHDFQKKGAGIIERYYGTASSAPAAVFPLLCRLARHHLSKVRKDDEFAANRIDNEIGEILKKFQPAAPGESPKFKRMLTLPEQGIFALGFYQQRAYDRACATVLSKLSDARKRRDKKEPFDEPLTKARDLANEFGYADLIASVNEFHET